MEIQENIKLPKQPEIFPSHTPRIISPRISPELEKDSRTPGVLATIDEVNYFNYYLGNRIPLILKPDGATFSDLRRVYNEMILFGPLINGVTLLNGGKSDSCLTKQQATFILNSYGIKTGPENQDLSESLELLNKKISENVPHENILTSKIDDPKKIQEIVLVSLLFDHDFKTPLTKIPIQLEQIEREMLDHRQKCLSKEQVSKLVPNIEQFKEDINLLTDSLAFTYRHENLDKLTIKELLKKGLSYSDSSLINMPNVTIDWQSNWMKNCLTNIYQNALRSEAKNIIVETQPFQDQNSGKRYLDIICKNDGEVIPSKVLNSEGVFEYKLGKSMHEGSEGNGVGMAGHQYFLQKYYKGDLITKNREDGKGVQTTIRVPESNLK
jgi:K+-sensing histidine kinase KdpD